MVKLCSYLFVLSARFLTDGLGGPCVDCVSRLESGDLGLEITSGEPQVSDKIQKLMPSALVREMKFEIVEVTVVVLWQAQAR